MPRGVEVSPALVSVAPLDAGGPQHCQSRCGSECPGGCVVVVEDDGDEDGGVEQCCDEVCVGGCHRPHDPNRLSRL
ncbi:hypothetical protein Pmani_026794 [Petrolisthes manimaculis]|uniref:Uncharacterized protein n=1 Tax=Petrolisthes manimaculis TaxID=1843537 RepID=A0AAE1TX33_9EUCA|nr:hypothetical protein Pmani_026794 [Petrolisthes manimaculis]